jgi:plastocyanin
MDVRRRALAGLVALALVAAAGCRGGDPDDADPGEGRFRPPAPYRLAELASERRFECASWDERCAHAYVQEITVDHGPGAALALVALLQRRGQLDRSVDDHQIAHAVGRETARRFGFGRRAFELCPIAFNYGCVHGFFEYVLGRTATPRDAASVICDSVGQVTLTERFSCYHGVGHGVMMARAYDLQSALGVCDALGEATARDGCWQGVFMENVNAATRNEARAGVFTRAKPLAPCTVVADRHRHECFINHAGWLVHVANGRIGDAARICLGAPSRHVSACAQSLGLMVTNPVWQTVLAPDLRGRPGLEVAWALCLRFPERLRGDCVIGALDNIASFDQTEIGRAKRFCAVVAPRYRRTCHRQIGLNLSRRSTDHQLVTARCAELGSDRAACVAGAAGVVQPAVPEQAPAAPATTPVTTGATQASPAEGAIVEMLATAFSPATLTVDVGDTVTFVNRSRDDKWPASDVHPTHERYPLFDARKTIVPGGTWSFRFERRGRWTYHDHLSPEVTGVIVVR